MEELISRLGPNGNLKTFSLSQRRKVEEWCGIGPSWLQGRGGSPAATSGLDRKGLSW